MTYRVLYPIYEKDFSFPPMPNGQPWQRVAEWKQIGTATSMDDAKSQFGGAPILEWVKAAGAEKYTGGQR